MVLFLYMLTFKNFNLLYRLKHYTDYMSYDDLVPECIDHKPEIDLGRQIHFKSACYIIAEIGQNHQGDIMMAKKLIKLAKVCIILYNNIE